MDQNSALQRRLMLGPDARGMRGMFSRGRNIYKGGNTAPNNGRHTRMELQRMALERRLKNGR